MELTISMFATKEDYWKARAEIAEKTVIEVSQQLECEADNEVILENIRLSQSALFAKRQLNIRASEIFSGSYHPEFFKGMNQALGIMNDDA